MTWKDIKRIHDIMDAVWDEYLEDGINGKEWTDEQYYGEVLRRYNETPDSSTETLLKVMAIQRRIESGELSDIEGLKLQIEAMKENW